MYFNKFSWSFENHGEKQTFPPIHSIVFFDLKIFVYEKKTFWADYYRYIFFGKNWSEKSFHGCVKSEHVTKLCKSMLRNVYIVILFKMQFLCSGWGQKKHL